MGRTYRYGHEIWLLPTHYYLSQRGEYLWPLNCAIKQQEQGGGGLWKLHTDSSGSEIRFVGAYKSGNMYIAQSTVMFKIYEKFYLGISKASQVKLVF